MKRGKGLKRHSRLVRKTPLEAKGNLERTSRLKRTRLNRGSKVRRRASIPPEIRGAVYERSDGRCIITGCRKRPVHLHHVLPVDEWPAFELEPDNMVGMCVDCHMSHEFGGVNRRAIYVEELPPCAILFAAAHGLGWFIARTYPHRAREV